MFICIHYIIFLNLFQNQSLPVPGRNQLEFWLNLGNTTRAYTDLGNSSRVLLEPGKNHSAFETEPEKKNSSRAYPDLEALN